MVEKIDKFKEENGVKVVWDGLQLSISGKGLKGTIKIGEKVIAVKVKVGLPASLTYYDIKEKLENELNKIAAGKQ